MNKVDELAEEAWLEFKNMWPKVEHNDVLELAIKTMAIQRFALLRLQRICTCNQPATVNPDGGTTAPGPHTKNCVKVIATAALTKIPF